MLTATGDFLMLTLWCVLAPALLVPAASLVGGRGEGGAQAAALIALTTVIFAAAYFFADAAVDLTAASPPLYTLGVLAGATLVLAGLVRTQGGLQLSLAISAALRPIVSATGKATGLFVLAMALIQFTVVVLRYVFGWNSILLQESVTYLHGGIFLLAAGYALLTNDHVRVDIFYGSATPRRRAMIDLFGAYAFLFPFLLLVLAMSAPYVANSWAALEGSTEQSGIQAVFLLKSLIPTFASLLLAAGFVLATDAARIIRETAPGRATAAA